MNDNLLFVGILNYNKGKFISDCINSVLQQKTSFKFRIHIVDDGSTDESPVIIKQYAQKYPDKITTCFHKENKGIIEGVKSLVKACNSPYFCALDADDYWIYDKKLQTQIDFLQANKDYQGCFHDAKIITTVGNEDASVENRSLNIYKYYSQRNHYKTDIYPEDLIKRLVIPTASLLVRFENLLHVIEKQPHYLSLYWVLQLEIIKNSKFKYFNEAWSVYRDHPGGVSKTHTLVSFKLRHIDCLKNKLNDEFYKNYKTAIYDSIAFEYLSIIWTAKHEKLTEHKLRNYLKEYKKYQRLFTKERIKDLKKYIVQ